MNYLKIIPSWLWVALGLLLGAWLYGKYQYNEGKETVQAEWNDAIERGKAEVARLKAEAGKITVKTEIRYVDRVKTIREKGDVIVREVTKFVPIDSGNLDGGFRVFHDAAVDNRIPDTIEIPNAAPVSITEVAATVARNYEQCHVAYAKVEEWQNWAREQCKLNKKGCPDGSE